MNKFVTYQHIEKFGTDEVEGIDIGKVYIFPKIDGTNGSVWFDGECISYASRKNELVERDNAGFKHELSQDERFKKFFEKYPQYRLYGEWLVPHTLRTYQENAWRKFYVFDVVEIGRDGIYIQYDTYKEWLDEFGIDYIPPQRIIMNPTYENLLKELEVNGFLMKDGELGEGIVLKNYLYRNKYGEQRWAKIIRNEFKELHSKEWGCPETENRLVEQDFVDMNVDVHLIDKTIAKIEEAEGTRWRSTYIPRLLNTVYHDLVTECIWDFIIKKKIKIFDFKKAQTLCIMKIKELKPELF
jgi:hypothetical protein